MASDQTPQPFDVLSLFMFLVPYFCMSVLTAGAFCPAGLFVPCLVSGATLGRVLGQVLNETVRRVGQDKKGSDRIIRQDRLIFRIFRIFRGLLLCSAGILCNMEWCIRKPDILLSHPTITLAYHISFHHTHIYPLII